MSKDWEIFTNESLLKPIRIRVVDINNVYEVNKGLIALIEDGRRYEYVEYLREIPIKKEVEECDFPHDKPICGVYKGEGLSVHTSNFCPKCGQDLRGEG